MKLSNACILFAAVVLPSAASTGCKVSPATQMDTVHLAVGEMQIYRFGSITLHAYITHDPGADVCYVLETPQELIGIELPPLRNNLVEFSKYIENLGKPLTGIIVSAHPAGGDYFKRTRIYATKANVSAAAEGGQISGIVSGISQSTEEDFDSSIAVVTDKIDAGKVEIGGVTFITADKGDGSFNIEIPAIKAVYMHMMGDKMHNIFPNIATIDDMSADLRDFREKGYNLYLTSHDLPRGEAAVIEKQRYLDETKKIIAASGNREKFIAGMKAAFPDYQGQQYLEMSAGALFAQ